MSPVIVSPARRLPEKSATHTPASTASTAMPAVHSAIRPHDLGAGAAATARCSTARMADAARVV